MSKARLDPEEFIELIEKYTEALESEPICRRIMSACYFAAMIFALEYAERKDGKNLKQIDEDYRRSMPNPPMEFRPSAHEGFRFLISAEFDRGARLNETFLYQSRIVADYKYLTLSNVGRWVTCDDEEARNAIKNCKELVGKIRAKAIKLKLI